MPWFSMLDEDHPKVTFSHVERFMWAKSGGCISTRGYRKVLASLSASDLL